MFRKEYLPFGKPNFSDEEIAAVTKVMRSGWVGMGAETIAFEAELADCLSAQHVVTVSSCTAALFLSLLVQGVKPQDEVICPSLTWCSTANAALYIGAKPVFCDIDPHNFCMTPELVQAKLTSQTKAVIVVHLGGMAVEVDKIRNILPDNVVIIEDAAHALGSKYNNGQPVGSSQNLTCFSFYANKNLSTGEGGGSESVLNDAKSSLPQDSIIFAVFTRLIKITPAYLDIVHRILLDNQNAHFLVVGTGDPRLIYSFIADQTINGRVTFLHRNVDLNVYGRIVDIFLDTFPFIGGNACREVSIHGKPIVFLYTLDFGRLLLDERDRDLLAMTADEYVAIAQRLATDIKFYQDKSEMAINLAKKSTNVAEAVANIDKVIQELIIN